MAETPVARDLHERVRRWVSSLVFRVGTDRNVGFFGGHF